MEGGAIGAASVRAALRTGLGKGEHGEATPSRFAEAEAERLTDALRSPAFPTLAVAANIGGCIFMPGT